MSSSQGISSGMSAGTKTTQEQSQRTRAINLERAMAEELATSDLAAELNAPDLEDEVEDGVLKGNPEEGSEEDELADLPNEDFTGQRAGSNDAESSIEPPEREDFADSDVAATDHDERSPFDHVYQGSLATLADLPRATRPDVRFAIDADYGICPLDLAADKYFVVRRALVLAVARHLQQHGVVLCDSGDWCHIPAIGSDDELIRLVGEESTEDTNLVDEFTRVLAKQSARLKSMAIQLPNGDVVKLSALMDAARKGKSATRAGALRLAKSQPSTVAGEKWSSADWKGFNETQRKKKYKPKAESPN